MANITFDKKTFEKEIGKLNDKLQDKIALFGTPIESMNDDEVEIEVNPDRPDLLSYHGFKRAFLAFLGKNKGIPSYKVREPLENYEVKISSSVEDVRPYTACAVIKGIKLNDQRIKEIVDVQEKLHLTLGRKRKKAAIGIYPVEKIKFPITFKALEPDKIKFIPLESEREMSGLQILQRHPAGREYAHLLSGKTKFPVFVDAENKIMSMPPIINSHTTGKIDTKTKDVFVECSGFDFNVLSRCLNILVTSLADMGGKVYSMKLKYKNEKITPDLSPQEKKISIENVQKLLGMKISEKEIKESLSRMQHQYEGKETGKVFSPAWRTDLLHENDLIEDIAIAYGYDNFTPELPEISTMGEENFYETLKRNISKVLSGLGMLEVSNYHLTKKEDQFKKMDRHEKKEKDFIEVENPKTDYSVLRKDLSHYLLRNLSENLDSEYPQKIFETGRVFKSSTKPSVDEIEEKEKMAVAISPGNFTEIKQSLKYLFKMMGIEMQIKEPSPENSPNHLIGGRMGEIFIKCSSGSTNENNDKKEKSIGFMGEVHPKILKNWKIRMPVSMFEIDLEEIKNILEE